MLWPPNHPRVATSMHRFAGRLMIVALAGCGSSQPPVAQLPPPTVTVAPPLERPITEYAEFTGRTEAVESVEVRARVNGYLVQVAFAPGTEVKKGDLLFEIDPRPYQADLEADQGARDRAEAQRKLAAIDFRRYEQLLAKRAASREEFDKATTEQSQAEAAVRTAQAAIDKDKLNLEFTRITSPIDGKIGRNQLTVGNLVKADLSLLTTIVSVDPMYVIFDVDERTMLRIQSLIRAGKLKPYQIKKGELYLDMSLANETGFPHRGYIDFVNNQVDAQTGTIRVRGVFPNPPQPNGGPRVLTPGLFCRVRLPVSETRQALLISERAIGSDQGKKFAFIVDKDNRVRQRPIQVGPAEGGMRVVEEGLSKTDRVIVNGIQRVRDGIVCDPQPAAEMTPEGTPTEKTSAPPAVKAAPSTSPKPATKS